MALAGRFEGPACVIVKHGQPCGAAVAGTPAEAYAAAFAADEQSAFGGIVAFNRALDGAAAALVAKQFAECVAAPDFAPEAVAAFESKKNLRVVRLDAQSVTAPGPWALRCVGPWALLSRAAAGPPPAWRVVTKRAPTAAEERALRFAWEVVAAARSNAIVLARGTALAGLGSGQTSRVDAVDVALMKARRAGHDPRGTVLASDGFFPFADSVEHAADAGVTAFVQPGGSVRDAEVIAACDGAGWRWCSPTAGCSGTGGLSMARELVLILDFGSQYTQLIARRVREQGVFSEIVPGTTPAADDRRAPAGGAHPLRLAGQRLPRRGAAARPRHLRAGDAGARHLLRPAGDDAADGRRAEAGGARRVRHGDLRARPAARALFEGCRSASAPG